MIRFVLTFSALIFVMLTVACGSSGQTGVDPNENVTVGTLEAGERYVVHQVPLAVPAGRDLRVGELTFDPCEGACQNGFYLHVVGTDAWIGILTPGGGEFARETGGDAALDAWFDELIASIGKPRTGSR